MSEIENGVLSPLPVQVTEQLIAGGIISTDDAGGMAVMRVKESDRFGSWEVVVPDDRVLFVKWTRVANREYREQIMREHVAAEFAGSLGLPVLESVTDWPLNTEDGGLMLVRQSAQGGYFLDRSEAFFGREGLLGQQAGALAVRISGKTIDTTAARQEGNRGTAVLKKDGRNYSPESFWENWNWIRGEVMDPVKSAEGYNGRGLNTEMISKIFDRTEELLKEGNGLLKKGEMPQGWFLVHNDLSPNNLFLSVPAGANFGQSMEVILADFEHGGSSKNRVLAVMTDLGNLYGRSWDQPEDFQTGLLEGGYRGLIDAGYDSETAREAVSAAVVYGTLYLSQWGFRDNDPGSEDFRRATVLLSSLPKRMEQVYQLGVGVKEEKGGE